ncbi:recombinase family protein [Microbispora sp. NPDC046973]|uniref:recombinase family protein n=1 Tax=Microbispora sp. NPDC046973 TaxID=3155022 RepID=UPI0033E858ED
MLRRAAICCRSQDRAGAGLGVARQEADCRVLAERRGRQVVDVYSDNDVSAYSGSPRPSWQRLLGHRGRDRRRHRVPARGRADTIPV